MKLSRDFDPAELKRLAAAWLDPEVTIAALTVRFRITHDDRLKLKAELGAKVRPTAACRIDGGKPHRLLWNGWATRG